MYFSAFPLCLRVSVVDFECSCDRPSNEADKATDGLKKEYDASRFSGEKAYG